MNSFDDRKKAYESKFALDAELKFKAESRRNKMIAEWAGERLGMTEAEIGDYVKAVRKSDFEEAGDDDVFRKVRADLDAKGVAVTDDELRQAMDEMLAKAVAEVEAG
ncbi:MAG: DUF1476 domain-containing protein [Hyphomicrobiaceae bacterium]